MYVDLWGWFDKSALEAYTSDNEQAQRLPQLYYQGERYLNLSRFDEAQKHFSDGLQLARQLNRPCWALFFEYWISEVYIFYKGDFTIGLDLAVKATARAYQEQYKGCPVRARVILTLIYTYFFLDPFGYDGKIREMLHYLKHDVVMDDDTDMRVQSCYAEMALIREDYDKCEEETLLYQDMVAENAFRLTDAYHLLSKIAYARGDIKQAFDYAFLQEQYAHQSQRQSMYGTALAWQAVFAQRTGQTERAENLMQRVDAHYRSHQDLARFGAYYSALCDYHEQRGDINRAIALRQEHLANTGGRPHSKTMAHIHYCRLLGRTGRDLSDALVAARATFVDLLKPDFYEAKLQRIEAGDYYAHAWQRPDSQTDSTG